MTIFFCIYFNLYPFTDRLALREGQQDRQAYQVCGEVRRLPDHWQTEQQDQGLRQEVSQTTQLRGPGPDMGQG